MKTILIIDDDKVIQRTTSLKLQELGFNVVSVTEVAAALATIKTCKPDIILLDINFPPDVANGGMGSWDGLALMYWLRGLKAAEQARFIIITGRDPATLQTNSVAQSAAAIFQKPINHEALLATIVAELQTQVQAAA